MSTLEVSNLNDGTTTVATTYVTNGSAKAWNNTSADGATINESFNISSLTDSSTGQRTHNVTSNLATTTYVPQMNLNNNNYDQYWVANIAATGWSTNSYDGSSYQDARHVTVAFGDLA